MIRSDFHMHTTYSDGVDSCTDMVRHAIMTGFQAIGFSEHGFAPYDIDCCIGLEQVEEYKREVTQLRDEYNGKIRILCGIEQDYFSTLPAEGYDYVIGSVHYLNRGEEYYAVDYLPENFRYMGENWFGGDYYAMADEYYRLVSRIPDKTGCNLIGHFDLISKLNPREGFFNEQDPHYVHAWKTAAAQLLEYGLPFEINTGAMFRGYRKTPYPAPEMIQYLAGEGACFVLSSDAHCKAAIGYCFDEIARQMNKSGIRCVDLLSLLK